ncbi:acyltransferase family protein [Pseudomonas sp. B21-053]|uniref:acyltransferase family protein n=1 Tax=Pseudomonas sp. B21-053 TaxID=2895493 RepID=UPI002231C298|nr:acyltransferase [Pseudomonas sp. B21-053]UZE14067.1 acyltransferase [Pseudomonas sp. B21-053]
MVSASSASIETLKPLTSLRFFAAFMIVVLHSLMFWSWFSGAPQTLTHGVSFFFVLSGFILTHVYTSKQITSYFGFIRDRLSRLWPVHLFALCFLVLFVRYDYVSFNGEGFFDRSVQLALNLTLMQSIFPFEKILFSWNSVSWSISTELFFYLAFPFLVIGIKKNWSVKLLVSAMASVFYVFVMMKFAETSMGKDAGVVITYAAYANPIFRGFEFCLGMSLWVVWDKYIRHYNASFAFWSLVESAALIFTVWWIFYGAQLLIGSTSSFVLVNVITNNMGSCWVFAILIAVVASGRGVVGLILSNRVLVYLGEISFSIYMLHLVLMKIFAFSFVPELPVTPLMYFSALLFLASCSYFMIEKPAKRLLKSRSKSRSEGKTSTEAQLVG